MHFNFFRIIFYLNINCYLYIFKRKISSFRIIFFSSILNLNYLYMFKRKFHFMASRKHTYIILTPLKPHFHIHVVKLGFTEVYIIFLISAQKHRLLVLVRTTLARRF